MKYLAALLLALTLLGCDDDSPTQSRSTAFAAFEWNYLRENQVTCNGQGCGVQFLDRSTGAKRWQWNFGDGGTSNLRDPIHFYRDDFCGRSSPCSFIVNLAVCPETDLRFDDERCSQVQNVVTVPPPT